MYIGGTFLIYSGYSEGEKWQKIGLYWLEDRARALIETDGTFSQYSVVYHRVMLDTYSFSETCRKHFEQNAFSHHLYTKLSLATQWMHQMVDLETGDTPNIGANDGTRILALTDTDYRDFRPSLQWAATLFCNASISKNTGSWDQPLFWLGLQRANKILNNKVSETLDKGGFHILRKGKSVVYVRYPRFRFRPSQSDALHLSLIHI